MNQLIPYEARMVGGDNQPTVDGRDLHHFLESARDYPSWVRAQIKRAQLIENVDYIVFTKVGENPQGGRPSHEYFFTFDAAKLISMMANSSKGHQIRQYFLSCEREWLRGQGDERQQVRSADMRAIIDMAISIDQNRQLAEVAREEAAAANANALLAMRGQQWVTIRQYVTMNHLERQMPRSVQQQYGRWLAGLCRERGIPVYFQRSQEFEEEGTYWISVLDETLSGWLNRRNSQGGLGLVP